ncbi:hypothetical protein AQI88_41265 [Streptomyces cellostaticus]|uniref:Secreted protein n=1 Tax=Streptomyces cellostaticus TaxID=67285 RepID=A0A117PQN9_9ACTN|nr:hypothetical protein [Streptomyces cellostaticus]KUM86448.1 hypothetical protein AQI88_41265 [Streptomyces cellostaticus]GHI10059.1 hypothetical protein Scel_83800 [Streptomyces cellostaticus]
MRKHARVGVIAASSLVAAVALASPASAATDSLAVARSNAGPSCTSLSNGSLCIALVDGGSTVRVVYGKTGGSAITAKLGYKKGGLTKYADAVTVKNGDTKVQEWKRQDIGCSNVIGVIAPHGQDVFETPPLHNPSC